MKRNLSVECLLCGTVMAVLLLTVKAMASRSSCHRITTDFRLPSSTITINNITGIPDREQVEIVCDCTAPRRAGDPEWSYNDQSLPDQSRRNDEPYIDSGSTLRVTSFNEDSSGLYVCHSRDVTVEFNLVWYNPDRRPELVVEPERQNIKIRNGYEKVTLECVAFGADIIWERRNGVVPDKAIQREGGAILEIPNARREDNGDYRCIAENRDGRTMSRYAAVSITEELKIITDPVDVTQRIGATVTLTCSSEGFQSENFTYLWTNSSDYSVYTEASSSGTSRFVIPAVGLSDAGEYRCIVQNEWGQQVTSKSADIQVEIPESFPPITMPSGSTDQFSVTLNWELSAVDVDLVDEVVISTEWTSLLVYDSGTNGKRQVTSNRATLTISDPTITQHTFTDLQPFSHYCFTVTALYAFEGQALGEVTAEPFCTNTSEAVPSAPQDVTVVTQGFTSLALTWTPPQSPNGIILNYTVKYNDEVAVVAVEDTKSTFILSQLPADTTYEISVSATNNAGEGIYSNIITTSTLSRAPTGDRGQLMFQIKLESDEIQFCPTWINDDHRRLIASAVVDLIQTECNCVLEEEAIDQVHLLCDQSQLDKTVFRAEIITYQLTRDDLLIIIQNMVTGRRLLTLDESTVFRLDDNCPVEISSFSDPLCAGPIIDSVEDQETKSKKSSPTAAIVSSITAILVVILLLIFAIVLVLYWRAKHRKVTADDEVGEVRYNNNTSMLQTVPQTMPYSTPMPLTHLQMECVIDSDGYLIPNKHKMENADFPIPYFDFDDASLKSIINDKIEGNSQVEMQANPSYFKTDIPDDNSTEV